MCYVSVFALNEDQINLNNTKKYYTGVISSHNYPVPSTAFPSVIHIRNMPQWVYLTFELLTTASQFNAEEGRYLRIRGVDFLLFNSALSSQVSLRHTTTFITITSYATEKDTFPVFLLMYTCKSGWRWEQKIFKVKFCFSKILYCRWPLLLHFKCHIFQFQIFWTANCKHWHRFKHSFHHSKQQSLVPLGPI